MPQSLRLIIADADSATRIRHCHMVEELGHQVVAECQTGVELLEACQREACDAVLLVDQLPGLNGIEAVSRLNQGRSFGAVLVAESANRELIDHASQQGIDGYLIRPLTPNQLDATLNLAVRRRRAVQAAFEELAKLRRSLAERKIIERAKGVLMKHVGLSEADAYRRLQKLSWDKNQKLIDIAQLIITAQQAMEPDEAQHVKPWAGRVARRPVSVAR